MKFRTRCQLTKLSTLLSCQSAIMDIEASLTQSRSVRVSKKTKGQLREIEKQAGRLFLHQSDLIQISLRGNYGNCNCRN